MNRAIVKKLTEVSKEEQKGFIESFDTIIFDFDGVLWPILGAPFPYTAPVIRKLMEVGKKVFFVTNNTASSFQITKEKFEKIGVSITREMLIDPIAAEIHYLKSINFTQKIFALASGNVVNEIKKAGFDVIEPYLGPADFTPRQMLERFNLDESIGAVIIDNGLNINVFGIYNAIVLLGNPNILYIVGGTEKVIPVDLKVKLFAIGSIQEIVNQCTNRQPMIFGKPGQALANIVRDICQMEDAGRAVFVGDRLDSDISFASICGFQKLLVLSGMTSLKQLENCETKECIPDYYTDSIEDLLPLLNLKD